MNISDIAVAKNYAAVQPSKLTQLTVSTPQAGFRCDPSTVAKSSSSGGSSTGGTLIQNIDWYDRKGFQTDYSIRDAAASLFKQEHNTFHLFDQESVTRHFQWLQNRYATEGTLSVDPTERELNTYMEKLRREGLDGEVRWSALRQEFKAFQATSPEELSDSVDYLASRYVAVLDKLERNYAGEELEAQKTQLEEVYQTGVSGLTEGYAKLLQENLGVTGADVQDIKSSLHTALAQRVEDYRGAMDEVNKAMAETGEDSVWLKNCDAYLASQLRKTGAGTESGKAAYSVSDLTAAGKIAKLYQSENASVAGRDEAKLALNLGMADMKAEKLISTGMVNRKMAELLKNSREAAHSAVLDAADQYLAKQEANRGKYVSAGTYVPMDREMFRQIYSAVMNNYKQSGDAPSAIRAGAAVGQSLTEAANKARPNVLRWGTGMTAHWQNFYTTPHQRNHPLHQQISQLLQQANLPDKSKNATYQNYVNGWQSFLTSIGSDIARVDVMA